MELNGGHMECPTWVFMSRIRPYSVLKYGGKFTRMFANYMEGCRYRGFHNKHRKLNKLFPLSYLTTFQLIHMYPSCHRFNFIKFRTDERNPQSSSKKLQSHQFPFNLSLLCSVIWNCGISSKKWNGLGR